MELTDLYFHKLTNHFDLQSFDCDDISINEFVHVDALNFQTEKMANTYVFTFQKRK